MWGGVIWFFFILFDFFLAFLQLVKSQTYKLHPLEDVSSPITGEIRLYNMANQMPVVTENQINSMNALDLASALGRVSGITISRHNLLWSYGWAQGASIL